MPTLEWIGKDKVVNHHLDVPYRVLERQYSYDADGQHDEDNGSENMIIHGDNLEALKSLLPQYEGRVKCIYIDPPYNTGNEGWVYNDNVNDPRIKKWLGEVVGKEGEDLSRHDKWLCMMYPRLKLLQKLLAEDGVIFASLDYHEQPVMRLIMDEVFGASIKMKKYFSVGCDKIVLFGRVPNVQAGTQEHRYSTQIINNNYVLCAVHLPSQLHSGNEERRQIVIQSILESIHIHEAKIGTNKTIIFGDMNEDPYEKGCLSALCFHGLPNSVDGHFKS